MQLTTTKILTLLAALALATSAAAAALGYRVHAADQRALARLEARLDALSTRAAPAQDARLRETDVERLLDALQARLASLSRVRAETGDGRASAAAAPPTPAPRSDAAPSDAERERFETLVARLAAAGWDPSGSAEDFEAFLALAKEGSLLTEAIADLEARVATDPGDVEARLALADLYIGKLMTVSGPEQGLWGGKAEQQWKETVARDDDQWRAHSALGTNYSYYPTVMDKTDDAIHHLTRAMELAQFEAPAAQHVQTYLFLSRMHEREGELTEARSVLELGLTRHPGEPSLVQALDGLPD